MSGTCALLDEEELESLPPTAAAAMAADGERLLEEVRLLEQMPQVRLLPKGIFDYAKPAGTVPRQRGIVVKLSCCKTTIDQKCNSLPDSNPKACPTHVEAARLLRAKVQTTHGSAGCLVAHAERAAQASTPTERTVTYLMECQLGIQRAHRELTAAQQRLEESIEAERVASDLRVVASSALEEVRSHDHGPCARIASRHIALFHQPSIQPSCRSTYCSGIAHSLL